MIFHPREIPECMATLRRLPIDKVWLTGYTEAELEGVVPEVIADAKGYTHVLAESDDGIVPPQALAAVLQLLERGHPVVTGYSNLDQIDFRVNLTRSPFRELAYAAADDYDLYHLSDVMAWPEPAVPTYFAAYALTGMSREMWLRYPFQTTGEGWASDWDLSCRLQADGIPIVAAREGFTYHVKEVVGQLDEAPEKRLLVGELEPVVEWDACMAVAA
jgi:hypothetical protein